MRGRRFSHEEATQFARQVMKDEGEVSYGLVAFRGSIAHETYVPNDDPNSIDDIDLIGFVVPDIEHYYGLRQWGSSGTKEVKDGALDAVFYELRKLVRLLAKANPNVLAMLFLEPEFVLKDSEGYWMLRENRDFFLSKDVYHPFIGYAHSQLKRMEAFSFEGYMGEKRKRLVESVGYDCKNAAHLIRLLRMGKELLETGEMHVHRGDIDAAEIIDIKTGNWAIEEVKEEADKLFEGIREAKENSPLPDHVNMDNVNKLCVEVVRREMHLSNRTYTPDRFC